MCVRQWECCLSHVSVCCHVIANEAIHIHLLLWPVGCSQEAIVEEQESRKDDNIHLTRFLRVLANFLVLCCLAGSGYLIYYVVRRSQKFTLAGLENYGWWERNEVGFIVLLKVYLSVQSSQVSVK